MNDSVPTCTRCGMLPPPCHDHFECDCIPHDRLAEFETQLSPEAASHLVREALRALNEARLANSTVAEYVREFADVGIERDKLVLERDDFRNRWLRTAAEFENYQKRVKRDQERNKEDAVRGIADELASLLAGLSLGLSLENSHNLAPIHSQLLAILEKRGVKPIVVKEGDAFDPTRHQAFSKVEKPGVTKEEVDGVVYEGYMIGDRVLRAAVVKLRKPITPAAVGNTEPTK